MTLVAGIVLPNGILMVSDTKQMGEHNDKTYNDYARKITYVTDKCIIGTAGSESAFYAGRILRNSLYNNSVNLDTETQRKYILDLYDYIDRMFSNNHPEGHPVGSLLIGDFDVITKTYSLTSVARNIGRKTENTTSGIKAVEIIGASESVRNSVKTKIQTFLDILPDHLLHHVNIYKIIAEKCHNFFKEEARAYDGINDKLYFVYLTRLEGLAAEDTCLIDSDGVQYQIDAKQDGKTIDFQK